MEETDLELEICVVRDDAGYGFSITGVTTFSISKLTENGAAERAGLKVNDVIRRVNGQVPKGNNKLVHKMITASNRVDLVVSRKLLRPTDSTGTLPRSNSGTFNSNSNGQSRSSDNPTDEARSRQSSEKRSKLNEKSSAGFSISEAAARGNIPGSLKVNAAGDETDTIVHSSNSKPNNEQSATNAKSPAELYSDEVAADCELPAESSSRGDSRPPSAGRRLLPEELARLTALSQLAQSDDELDERSIASAGSLEQQTATIKHDQRLTHELCAAFTDLARLRDRPAHLAAVLNYGLLNADATPLLVTLVCELYRSTADSGNLKEMKRWATEIYASFLADRAPLRLLVDESLVHSVESAIQNKAERDEPLKQLFQPVSAQARELATCLLRDFVGVLARGLGTLYGVQDLSGCEALSKAEELRILEARLEERVAKLLDELSHRSEALNRLAGPSLAAALADVQRVTCLLHALLTVARIFGVPVQSGALQAAAERFTPFCTKNKRLSLKRFAPKPPSTTHSHQFALMQFAAAPFRVMPTLTYSACAQCGVTLWTIGAQGLQCAVCDLYVHCDCSRFATEPCGYNKPSSTPTPAPTPHFTQPAIAALKDANAKRPRSVNVISALPNIIRKNLPGGATLGREAKKHPTILQSYSSSASADDAASPSSLTPTIHQSQPSPILSPSLSVGLGAMAGLAAPDGGPPPPPLPATSPPPASALSTFNEKLDEAEEFGMIDGQVGAPAQTGRLSSLDSTVTVYSAHPQSSDVDTGHKRSRSGLPTPTDAKQRSISSGVRPDADSDSASASVSVGEQSKMSSTSVPVETELEVDNDRPLETLLGRDVYGSLKKRERERQQAIHELITTELSHVRWLIILQRLFHAAWPSEFNELRELLMPNVADLLELHRTFAHALRETRDPRTQLVPACGAMLDTWFGGEEHLADWTTVPARFCAMHFLGIERLRKLRHKEAALDRVLSTAEADPLCRRKQLTDLLACEMQRVTKYTLLLERVLKPTIALAADGDHKMAADAEHLRSAIDAARRIAVAVNTHVRDRQNAYVLAELARRIDDRMSLTDAYYTTSVGSVEKLARRRMQFEGLLKWQISKQRVIDIRCVLLDSVLLLLQVVDEKLVLKVHSAAPAADRFLCSPIVPLQHVHVREDAADKRLFYVLNRDKGHSVMYDLIAPSHEERKKWISYITEAAETVKQQQSAAAALSGSKRKNSHALRNETHAETACLPSDRRSLARTLALTAGSQSTDIPASSDNNGLLAIDDAAGDAETNAGASASATGADRSGESSDGEACDTLVGGSFTRSRMTSLRATLRKHNRKGFDDTFLDTFSQPSADAGKAQPIAVAEDIAPIDDGAASDEDSVPRARTLAHGARRRSSLSELNMHVCNQNCSFDDLANKTEPIREVRDAEVDSRSEPEFNLLVDSDEEVAAADLPESSADAEACWPRASDLGPLTDVGERADSLRPTSRLSVNSESPVVDLTLVNTEQSSVVARPLSTDSSEIDSQVARGEDNTSHASAADSEAPTNDNGPTLVAGSAPKAELEAASVADEHPVLYVSSASLTTPLPTRVTRNISRDVRTEKHVLRVDEAERIAKQIAKQDRVILDGLNERQRLLTSFLSLQRNLLRVTNLNAEAQRTRISTLQTSAERPRSQSPASGDEQRSRTIGVRPLIENALKQAKTVLEFMTTYQPGSTDPQNEGSNESSNSAVSTNGLGMYTAMPLSEALKVVDSVNQSLLELITLFESTKGQLETARVEESYSSRRESEPPARSPSRSSPAGDNVAYVAISSRSIVLNKVSRTVSSFNEEQLKPRVVVEAKLAGANGGALTDLPQAYFDAVARVIDCATDRREQMIVSERARIVISSEV